MIQLYNNLINFNAYTERNIKITCHGEISCSFTFIKGRSEDLPHSLDIGKSLQFNLNEGPS